MKPRDKKLLEGAKQTTALLNTLRSEGKHTDYDKIRVVDKKSGEAEEFTVEEWIVEDLLDIDSRGWNRGFMFGCLFSFVLVIAVMIALGIL